MAAERVGARWQGQGFRFTPARMNRHNPRGAEAKKAVNYMELQPQISVVVFVTTMPQRGEDPIPIPMSECPNPECRRRFEASVETCPFCHIQRGGLERSARAQYQARRQALIDS